MENIKFQRARTRSADGPQPTIMPDYEIGYEIVVNCTITPPRGSHFLLLHDSTVTYGFGSS